MPILKARNTANIHELLLLATLLLAFLSSCRSMEDAAPPGQTRIKVNDTLSFLKALGSNRNVILAEGTYVLTDLLFESRYVERHNVFDGYEYVLRDVTNLSISGAGPEKVKIQVRPRYANVLRFINARNIAIEGVSAGHTSGDGSCVGGVFVFENASNIRLKKNDLYGSGTQGLELTSVEDLYFEEGAIRECTYHAFTIHDSKNIRFRNIRFEKNREFSQFNATGSEIAMDGVLIQGNTTTDELFHLTRSSMRLSNSKISGNRARALINPDGQQDLTLSKTTLEENDFQEK